MITGIAATVLVTPECEEDETAHTAADYQTNLIRLSSEFFSIVQDDMTEEDKRRLGDLHFAMGEGLQKFRKASVVESLTVI